MKPRSQLHRLGRIYDEEIWPVWTAPFARMMLRDLHVPAKGMVLDVACATGQATLQIARMMPDDARIIATDTLGALLDVARQRARELAGKRIFFRTDLPSANLGFGSGTFDLVVSNLGLLRHADPQHALHELARVAKAGGMVVVTLPLAGTYDEIHRVLRRILGEYRAGAALAKLNAGAHKLADPEAAKLQMDRAGLTSVELETHTFQLLFEDAHTFFSAPVIEYGPMAEWRQTIGQAGNTEEILWRVREALDADRAGKPLSVTINAGCLRGAKSAA